MLGHSRVCGRRSSSVDYVLAHGYVREDHVLDEDLRWDQIPHWRKYRSRSKLR